MLQFADKSDMPMVAEIWQEAFLDTAEEVADFFSALAGQVRVCTWKEEDRIAGQLMLLPISLHSFSLPQKDIPAEYIYAVAVKKEYRHRGIATKLLEAVSTLLKKEEKGAVLVPADAALVSFYEKRGYQSCFSAEETLIEVHLRKAEGADAAFLEQITVLEYETLRKQAFAEVNYVVLSTPMLSYALHLHQNEGGSIVKLDVNGKQYGILFRQGQEREAYDLYIQEVTAGTTKEAVRAAGLLLGWLGLKTALLQRSYHTCARYLPDSMQQEGYFNLVLD